MITLDEAKAIILAKLAAANKNHDDDIELILLDDETIEKEWGWVFFYQNRKYIETGEFRFMVAGNAPYLVNKYTGEVKETGTAYEIEYYIKEYESTL